MITLTTDFGLDDPYVGIMKGVILGINPNARIIDISHGVPPGEIAVGAAMLQEAFCFFPKGTIHVGVIDPGVGGERRPILVQSKDHVFVGPDNGLFFRIIRDQAPVTIIHLTHKKYFMPQISSTFHGRDIFAPTAAHLSRGVHPRQMGVFVSDPKPLSTPMPRQSGDKIMGQIVRSDHFGNLITNIHGKDLKSFMENAPPIIVVGDIRIDGLKNTYTQVKEGEILALIGSSGYLEVAVNRGKASDRLTKDLKSLSGIAVEVIRT